MLSKEIKFLLTHSSIYGLGTVISRLVAFILLPLYTRYLTPGDYGTLELIDITSGIAGVVVSVGIAGALARFYYEFEKQKERNKVLSTTYITYFVLACLSAPLLFYISEPMAKLFLGSRHYSHFFKISFGSLLIGVFIDIGLLYLRLIKKSFAFISLTISRLALLILFNIIFIVHFKMGLLGILYSSLIVRGLYAVVMTSMILWKTKNRYSIKLSYDMLRYSLPLIPSRLAGTFVKQSDKYFVLHFVSLSDLGIYSLALKLGNAIHYLLTVPFNLAYIPRRFEIMKRDDAREIYAKMFTYHAFLLAYIGLGLSVLIPDILEIIVTPKFFKARLFVPLVVFSMIIFGCHNHFNFGILYSKKTKYIAYINLACASINLGLNFILIVKYGLWGAITSSVIVLSIQAFLLYFISNKLYPIKFEFMRILKYIFISFIFYGVSRQIYFDVLALETILKIVLLLLFPITVVLLKIITPEETSKVKEIYTERIRPLFLKTSPVKSR